MKMLPNPIKPLKLEIQSLAVLRIGIAITILLSLFPGQNNHSLYDSPSAIIENGIPQMLNFFGTLANHNFSPISYLLSLALIFTGLILLIGHKTRLATILSLCLCSVAYVLDIGQFPLTGKILVPTLLWSVFLPVGAAYSLDNAMNLAKPIANSIFSSATIALTTQQCFNYWMPESPFALTIVPIDWQSTSSLWINIFTLLVKLGPILLLMPFQVRVFRPFLIATYCTLHLVTTLFFGQSTLLLLLAVVTWFAFLPGVVWQYLNKVTDSQEKKGLIIYYDADCGFCKKIVHVLRTLLILPGTPLLTAQSDASICKDMETYNSWVVLDWQEKRHFKFEAIAYISSISPFFFVFEPVLRCSPIMTIGTFFYEAIASNRRKASLFTRFLKFHHSSNNIPFKINFLVGMLVSLNVIKNLYFILPKLGR